MAITLQQPLGTDIYNVEVFNQNSEIIENAINALQNNVDNLNIEIVQKLPFVQVTDSNYNIDTILEDGIYYFYVTPTGILPDISDTFFILLSIKSTDSTQSTQIMFTNNSTHYRTVTTSNVEDWLSLKVIEVENVLTSINVDNALSANQGRVLNDIKLDKYYYTNENEIDFNNISSGIYNCVNTQVTNAPNNLSNTFILEVYGESNALQTQIITNINSDGTSTKMSRYTYLNGSSWQFSAWTTESSLDDVSFELVDI